MKFALPFLLFGSLAFGQPVLTMSTTGQGFPGATLQIALTLSGSANTLLAGIGLTAPGGVSHFTIGPASVAATKSIFPAGTGPTNLVLVGFKPPATVSNTPFSDGVILTFNYYVPTTATLGSQVNLNLRNVFGASTAGNSVTLTAPTLSIPLVSAACAAVIQTAISAYNTSPSQAGMNTIQQELQLAQTSGTCQ